MKRCDTCNGHGEVKGVFHQMQCDACNATGVLHKDTGEQIDTSLVMIAMRRVIKQQRLTIESLKKNQQPHDPYGDLKEKNGGKFRMD